MKIAVATIIIIRHYLTIKFGGNRNSEAKEASQSFGAYMYARRGPVLVLVCGAVVGTPSASVEPGEWEGGPTRSRGVGWVDSHSAFSTLYSTCFGVGLGTLGENHVEI